MALPAAVRLPFQFDVERILREVEELQAEDFAEIPSSYITPNGLLAAHLLVADPKVTSLDDEVLFVPSGILESCSYIREVLDSFLTKKQLARVHKLQPGAQIAPHIDSMSYELGIFRVHIPVSSGTGAGFILDGKALQMSPGEAWFLDVSRPHHVANDGEKERIHLVFDCHRNSWSDELFSKLGYELDKGNAYRKMTGENLQSMLALLKEMETEGSKESIAEVEAEIARRIDS